MTDGGSSHEHYLAWVGAPVRAKYLRLVADHPGRTAQELETCLVRRYDRSRLGDVLRFLLARRCVRRDEDGRYWVP